MAVLSQALFLLGWGASMIWGPIADRYGRVKALMWTILFYSIFTFMCGIVTNVYQLAFLRILCGIGLGGEQPMGGTFVAEEWPEDRRKAGAGYMHTGYYFGFFLAALANYLIAGLGGFSWRWMFVLGGAPALLVGWIQHGVNEPEAWKKTAAQAKPKMMDSFKALFTEEYRMRTIINSALFTVSIIELCSGFLRQAILQWGPNFGKGLGLGNTFVFQNWGMVSCVAGITGGIFAGAISDQSAPMASQTSAGVFATLTEATRHMLMEIFASSALS